MKIYTCNVVGNYVNKTLYSSYYSEYTNITAIEIMASNKKEARKIVKSIIGVYPVYIYE